MKGFKEFLIEGAFQKYKVGNEPKFKNKQKQEIANRLREFVKLNPDTVSDIHYPGSGKLTKGYNDDNQMEVKVTDKQVLSKITKYMNIYDVKITDNESKVSNNQGKFLFKFSSGRGFFFASEKSQTTPSTTQQETGTIKFLEYYQVNGEFPTHNQINEIVGFVFDEGWYKSFKAQSQAIIDEIKVLTSNYKIDLDSNPKSIGSSIFKMLKSKFSFKEAKDNWNPADIWIYNSNSKSKILTDLDSTGSLVDFNAKIKEFYVSGQLYGISLKKVIGNTAKKKVIDTSNIKPFDLSFAKTTYNLNNTYWDIMTTGYPERFMIRARAKAKAISKKSDIRIFFEGKLHKSTEFLGAIPTKYIKTPGSDTVTFDVTSNDVLVMASEVESYGFMTVLGKSDLEEFDEMKLIYSYVMLRYAKSIYSAGDENLKKLAMAGYKLNDFSSIHLKIGG